MIDLIYTATTSFIELSQKRAEQCLDKQEAQNFCRQLTALEAQLVLAYKKNDLKAVISKAKTLVYLGEEFCKQNCDSELEQV